MTFRRVSRFPAVAGIGCAISSGRDHRKFFDDKLLAVPLGLVVGFVEASPCLRTRQVHLILRQKFLPHELFGVLRRNRCGALIFRYITGCV